MSWFKESYRHKLARLGISTKAIHRTDFRRYRGGSLPSKGIAWITPDGAIVYRPATDEHYYGSFLQELLEATEPEYQRFDPGAEGDHLRTLSERKNDPLQYGFLRVRWGVYGIHDEIFIEGNPKALENAKYEILTAFPNYFLFIYEDSYAALQGRKGGLRTLTRTDLETFENRGSYI